MEMRTNKQLPDVPFRIEEDDEILCINDLFKNKQQPEQPEQLEAKPKTHISIPLHNKFLLTIAEASDYFSIGESKLRNMIRLDPYNNYTLRNGKKVMIKRVVFEQYLNDVSSI